MILGIDLGTTNTVSAIVENGVPRVLPTAEGGKLLPSIVTFSRTGERVVGDVARRQLVVHPDRTIHSAKRFIGRRYADATTDLPLVQYEVVETRTGDCGFRIDGRVYSPAEISAAVLQRVKQAAEAHLGTPITEAVITVPAHFDDRRRQATRDAAAIAGLEVARVLNEPTAAALAWLRGAGGAQRPDRATLAVYDFGGGTFDISIVRVDGDVAEVRATRGDNALGGADIDRAIEEWLLDVARQDGVDLHGDRVARQRLREAAEAAKIDLSTLPDVEVRLPFLGGTAEVPYHLACTLTRAQLEQRIAPLIERTLVECRLSLKEAAIAPAEVDEVVLVGGSSRIPAVRSAVGALFGRTVEQTVNPEDVVALGAALQAASLEGRTAAVTLLDVTSFALGVEVAGGRSARLIPKNAPLPAQRTQMVTTASDDQSTVRIHVLQGEGATAAENTSLGQFELTGIAPGPKGSARIEVTFGVDTSGMVRVSAVDTRSGAREAIQIRAPGSLDAGERERMSAEAREIATRARDTQARREAETALRSRLPAVEACMRSESIASTEAELLAERAYAALAVKAPTETLRELIAWADRIRS